MKHRGRWPVRDYAAQTGKLVTVTARLPGLQKAWIDEAADMSGRTLASEFANMVTRAQGADIDLLLSHDLNFGRLNNAVMLMLGLILLEAQRNASEPWGRDPETDAVVAEALALTIGLLFDVDISISRPNESADDKAFDKRVYSCLRPLYEIRDYFCGERLSPARFMDEKIIDRLNDELSKRILALPPREAAPVQPDSAVREHPSFIGSQHFWTAWSIAQNLTRGQLDHEPSNTEIAEYLRKDAGLLYLCGLHIAPQSVESILAYHAQLEQEEAPSAPSDEAPDPTAVSAPTPLRPAKRRRSAPPREQNRAPE